jgi:nucleotide-binding universal stress UspA family protein
MTHPTPPARDIVFATDFSSCSTAAAKVAAEYARALNARLHVLHVTLPGVGKKHLDNLKEFKEETPPSVPVVTSVESGNPATQIVRYAERCGADLIVLGTHGRTGVSRALLGSVAERVVRTASCPVLAVPLRTRRPQRAREEPPPAALRRGCLVCGKTSDDLICEACRDRIRAESLDRKLDSMRKGRN